MPRRPAHVTQADIARAIRAVQAAGYTDVRVVFREGTISVEAAPEEAALGGARPKKQDRIIVL